MLISLVSSKESYRGCFRFDRRFLNKPLVKEAIISSWNEGTRSGQGRWSVADRLRCCRKALSNWKRENNVNSREKIIQLQIALEVEQSKDFPSFVLMVLPKNDMTLAYREEETFWSQKCRDKWLLEGDGNMKFFHASVKASREKKRIHKIKDVNGVFQRNEV